jgi:hypothetical protein
LGITKPLGIGSNTFKSIFIFKKMNKKQMDWQDHVLNKFALPHVQASITEWEVTHPGQSFSELSAI